MPGDLIVQSWDTAIATGANNDYSVCSIWHYRSREYFLLDVFRDKLNYSDQRDKALELAIAYGADLLLIERSSNGYALAEDLRQLAPLNILELTAVGNKVDRMSPGTADIDGGKVFLPEDAGWLPDFLHECAGFPGGKHDDQVDSMAQFLNWAREKYKENSDGKNMLAALKALADQQYQRQIPRTNREIYAYFESLNATKYGDPFAGPDFC